MQFSFSIKYNTRWGESLAVVLNDSKYPMQWHEGSIWSVTVNCRKKDLKDYWYVVMEDGLITRTEWEHHSNDGFSREITDSWTECPFPGCPFTRKHQAEVFDTPGFRGAGAAVPVFSLRTADDFGIGEFRDLIPLIDWAAATGMCIIQLLPVNDTTRSGGWEDSYPYSPVSSFALNPMYIHLQDLGITETPSFKKLQKELNSLSEIDYPRVFEAKTGLVNKAWKKNGSTDMQKPDFIRFCKENSFWLDGYADFCSARDGIEADCYRWQQWHLDRQFKAVAEYARSKGVYLKGDLPIGVSADSAEAARHPELFNLDSCAGAPPDFFSSEGQNWGFPTYNWDSMALDDYAWWKARLRRMSRYFDAFRIDHILGFFRIWEIPAGTSGLHGHFNPALPYSAEELSSAGLPVDGLFNEDPRHPGMFQPAITPHTEGLEAWQKERFDAMYRDFFFHRHNDFWRRNAERKLPELLSATGMLACGEDLGMIPDCVNGVMDHEKILSLEMACMDKGRPWPYLAVCATSSHDLPTLRMSWAYRYGTRDANGMLCEDMPPEAVREAVRGHLNSAPMLAIFPLQDWLGMDGSIRRKDLMSERVNEPSDPHHHWRYRVHLTMDELKSCDALNSDIRRLIQESGRDAKQ